MNALAAPHKVIPRAWRGLAEALQTGGGYRLELFWNRSGKCFTARVLDGIGRFAPPEEEGGELWAASGPDPVAALQNLVTKIWADFR